MRVDPDQKPRVVASFLSLHCFPRPVSPTTYNNEVRRRTKRNLIQIDKPPDSLEFDPDRQEVPHLPYVFG